MEKQIEAPNSKMAAKKEVGTQPSTSTGDAEKPPVSYTDFMCVICLQLLVEPVVLPCKHELCMHCFKTHVHSTSLCCPMCRIRISNWARKKSREGNLIDQERWELIQKLFPERCKKRMNGEEEGDEDDYMPSSFCRVVAREGELRKEYEIEMEKVEKERAEEIQASEEVIKLLLEEEEAFKKNLEKDEKMAKQLQQEELKTAGSNVLSPNSKLSNALDILKLPKEMTLRSRSTSASKDTSVDAKSKSCMSNWLSKSQQASLESQPVGSSNRIPHRSRQEEDDFHIAFKLQRDLDLEEKRMATPKTFNQQFYPLRKNTVDSRSSGPASKRLKTR